MAKIFKGIRLEEGMIKDIEEMANKEGRNWSNMLEWIIKKGLQVIRKENQNK